MRLRPLLIALIALHGPSVPAAGVKEAFDRFEGRTKISYTEAPRRSGDMLVNAYVDLEQGKPASVYMILATSGEDWEYLRCHDVRWLLDGKRWAPKETGHEGQVFNGGVAEMMLFTLTLPEMEAIGAAKSAEFQVCTDEFALTAEQSAAILDVVRRAKAAANTP
jgi:hypothetical protein